jgi:flagellar hook assembly protein FlgD
MRIIVFITILFLTASIFALEGFAISDVNTTLDNTPTSNDDHTTAVVGSMLGDAYPNPFRTGANNSTNINVTIKNGENGTVTIFNVKGQIVKTFPLKAGEHTLTWDGRDSSSGIYFYKLMTPSVTTTKKLVLLK